MSRLSRVSLERPLVSVCCLFVSHLHVIRHGGVSSAVHPKTGRVCVPINPANVREFDPFAVPTLGQLTRQVDQYDKEHGEEVSDRPMLRRYIF